MTLDIRNLKIGVVGLGYVGLPLAVEFGKKRKVVLSGALHPHYAEVVKTMAKFTEDEIAQARGMFAKLRGTGEGRGQGEGRWMRGHN